MLFPIIAELRSKQTISSSSPFLTAGTSLKPVGTHSTKHIFLFDLGLRIHVGEEVLGVEGALRDALDVVGRRRMVELVTHFVDETQQNLDSEAEADASSTADASSAIPRRR